MTTAELLLALLSARSLDEATAAVTAFENSNEIVWHPFGRRNNRGTIEASGDTGRSLVERATNGIDAILELEHSNHGGMPDCSSPKEAGLAWLGIPTNGLSAMSATQRRVLAQRVTLVLEEGEGRESRLVSVRDYGSGIEPGNMPNTILSLSEDNKLQKHYLAGTFGQGGSSTLAASKLCLIASRSDDNGPVGFTVAKYLDLPPEEFKTGHYVYLGTLQGVLEASIPTENFSQGTLCRHFGYDLDAYNSPIGPNSIYGLLNMVLFDPVMPVWLENKLHGWNRVIKGSRNALNGAVDEGDESSRGPSLDHNMPMFYADLGAFGRVGIEYWVLPSPSKENKRPSASFVSDRRPIILTSNGQNHAEFSVQVIRKDAELPFLASRLICHIDCDGLTPGAKRALFVSNREEARRGAVRNLLLQELVSVLKSDPELERLNREAKDDSRREQDESALARMRDEVAKLLRLQGLDVARAGGTVSEEDGNARPTVERRPRPPRPPLPPIEIAEPPTFLRFAIEEDPVTFYAGQRRYLRIETDANDNYYSADPSRSRIQVMTLGPGIRVVGQTALRGGRMRVGFLCEEGTAQGETGDLRVELQRTGHPSLSASKSYEVVAQPQARGSDRRVNLPPFEPVPVFSQDENWIRLGWPEDPSVVASVAEVSDGTLMIYYNADFPPYSAKVFGLETRDTSLASSFTSRYEIWLCMHSLLMYQDQQQAGAEQDETSEHDEQVSEDAEREERKRIANLSVMIAAREVALMSTVESES
ncbi:MAG: hypothetical protein JNK63_08555 [Chthonomonas sp.]|nr:hypothetical protein [Chthonomonas sp.]